MQFQDQKKHYKTTPGSTLSPQANGGQELEVDFVVRNVYSKIKSLENKYIDLANFYKEGSKGQKLEESKLPRNLNQTSSANQLETSMIQELYEKKRDLEENIKSLKTAVNQQKADPSLQVGQLKNTKRVLHQTFAEISNQVENAQTQCLKALAQKQNEMFQLATKHKISSAFRNETLGLWYDTKSLLAQTFAEVKQTVIQVQHQSEQQLGLSYVYHPKDSPPPALDHSQLSELNDQIYKFSRKQLKQKKELAKIQQSLQKNLIDLKNEHSNLMQLIEDLNGQHEDSSLTRKRGIDKSVYLSPFQRKLQTYSNPALGQGVLSSQKRSASKGTVSQQKIQPTNSATNFQSKSSRELAAEDNVVRTIKSKDGNSLTKGQLDLLKNGLKVQGLAIMQKQSICEDLFCCIDKINEEGSGFTAILQDLLQQSRDPNQVDQKDRLQELQQQNELIYSELRQNNEKYIDLRVENSKLRDQLFALQSKSQSTIPPPGERTVNGYQESQHRDLLDQMCERVNKFMQAMRQLQKAVNRKDPDVAGPKENFESSKTALQSLVVQVRELLHVGQIEQQQQYASASRSQVPVTSSSPLREKRATVSSSQLNKLPLLLQNVKNLQLEKQKMQELINELKLSHEYDFEQMQLKSKQKSERLQKFAAQCTYFQIKQQAQDQFLFECRQIILQKDSSLADHLSQREKQLDQKVQEDVARVQPSLRLDPQISALKEELVNQIKVKTQIFEAQIDLLSQQLKAKEEGLGRLKLLFVEKLHELETTFVEISNEVAETEQQNQQQAQQKRVPNQFERSVETVLSKFENDDREKDLEQLSEANAELLEQNAQLKHALQSLRESKNGPESQESAQLELVIELQDQLDSQTTQLQKQITKTKELEQSETVLKKEIQTLKYDNKRNQMDLKDGKERFEKAKNEYQAQFNGLKMTIISQKQQVDKEVELRQASEQSQQQLKKDISQIMTQKTLSETMNQNLTLELAQLRDQLQSQHETFEQTQSDLNERICAAQAEIELLKIQNIELHTKTLQRDDPEETSEILCSHMAALEKGSCIEIAVGDLKEVQLIKLIAEVQADCLIKRQEITTLVNQNTEMAFQIEELQTELRDKPEKNVDQKQSLDQSNTADAQLVSLQSQLQESQDLCGLQKLEITTLLQRLDFVREAMIQRKNDLNKLQQSLDRAYSELQTSNQKLAAAEIENESVNSVNVTNAIKLADLTKWTNEELGKISLALQNISNTVSAEKILPQQFATALSPSQNENAECNFSLDQSLIAQASEIQSNFRKLIQKLQAYQTEELQKSESTQLVQETHRRQALLLVCLSKRVHEIFERKTTDFQLRLQVEADLIKRSAQDVSDLQLQNDELQAQIKHLNSKLIVEKEKVSELDQKLKQQQINNARNIDTPSDLPIKLQDATQMLEKFKQEYQELKETSQQQIQKAFEQEQKTRQELEGKYKLEMKSFLQKAVDDRKRIQSDHQEELKKAQGEIDQLKTSENSLRVDLSDLQQQLTNLQSAHFQEIQVLRNNEQLANVALAGIQVELQESETSKKAAAAQYEEELRQAEEAHSELQTKMQAEIEAQAESYESQIASLQTTREDSVLNHTLSVYENKVKLSFALWSHLRNLLNAKFNQISQDFETQAIQKLSLEQYIQQAEYKQVQQEGELRRVTEEFKKYQKDANTLMAENIKRQSDLKKTDEAKKQEIASLQEYQSNLQEQIMDYAAQIQQAEAESEKLLEHVAELQSDLNKKDQMIESLQQKQKASPEKPLVSKEGLSQNQLLERKIQELQSLNQLHEELITQLKADNDRLKKTPEDKRNSWEFQNSGERGSWGSNGVSASQEVEEHLKHIRQIMIQFLAKLPFTTKENEEILPILFSMLNFKEGEIESVTLQRDELNKEMSKEKAKDNGKNIFGFGKKKQPKN